jgi:methyl-accepting chemotaxis protein
MKAFMKKILGTGVLATAAAVAVITAIGTVATLGVAKNVDKKIVKVDRQITESTELNKGMKGALKPTEELNDKAGTVGQYISEILAGMSGMRDGLAAMVATIGETNGVLLSVRSDTDRLTASLNELIPYINQLASAVESSNLASEASLGTLDEINRLNGAIAAEMAQMRSKLANSATYRVLFTFALPVLP